MLYRYLLEDFLILAGEERQHHIVEITTFSTNDLWICMMIQEQMSIEMHNGSSDHNKAEVFNGKMIIVHIKRRITTLNRSKFAFFSFIFDNLKFRVGISYIVVNYKILLLLLLKHRTYFCNHYVIILSRIELLMTLYLY